MNWLIWIAAIIVAIPIGYYVFQEILYIRYKLTTEEDKSRQDFKDNSMRDQLMRDC